MKNRLRNLKRKAIKILDLPNDVILDLPRLTMVGFLQLYIENHRGVLLFTDQELRLLLKKGQLIIRGTDLVIRTLLSEELFLEGNIREIQIID